MAYNIDKSYIWEKKKPISAMEKKSFSPLKENVKFVLIFY